MSVKPTKHFKTLSFLPIGERPAVLGETKTCFEKPSSRKILNKEVLFNNILSILCLLLLDVHCESVICLCTCKPR